MIIYNILTFGYKYDCKMLYLLLRIATRVITLNQYVN